MLKLKFVMLLLMDEDTVSVKVALTLSPAFNDVPSRFQAKVIGPLALAGFQPDVVMLNVTGTLPVFLTYTV
jgi:uncharacterized protein (DUF169 family)